MWHQNVPYGLIKKTSTHTLCFCSFIRKLQTFEIPRWTRGTGFSKWRHFSKEQLMYYYSGKNKTRHPATSHRSAVLFHYICAIACILLSRSSLVLVIFVGI